MVRGIKSDDRRPSGTLLGGKNEAARPIFPGKNPKTLWSVQSGRLLICRDTRKVSRTSGMSTKKTKIFDFFSKTPFLEETPRLVGVTVGWGLIFHLCAISVFFFRLGGEVERLGGEVDGAWRRKECADFALSRIRAFSTGLLAEGDYFERAVNCLCRWAWGFAAWTILQLD